ncbi:MAG: hypothetical protein AAF939_01255 [Planctomycetota bacterium]
MNALKKIQFEKLEELIAQFENGESVPSMWYVDHEGVPLWAQDPLPFCLIAAGMTVQPKPDRPEYRIADFEDHPNRDITIVRIIQVASEADRVYMKEFEAEAVKDSLPTEAGADLADSFDPSVRSGGSGIVAGTTATNSAADEQPKGTLKKTWLKLLGYIRKNSS